MLERAADGLWSYETEDHKFILGIRTTIMLGLLTATVVMLLLPRWLCYYCHGGYTITIEWLYYYY